MFSNKPYATVSEVELDGDKTTFTVKFGRVKTCSFGDSIASKPVHAGQDKWKVVYFPKGFTNPDYASVYVTNVTCDMDEGDADNPDRITSKSFGTVQLFMQPKPPPAPRQKPKAPDEEEGDDDEDEEDDASSLASAATPKSTLKGSNRTKSKKSGTSKRSSTSRKSFGEESQGGEEGAPVMLPDPIEKELSQMFTNKAPSWGFEKLFDIGKLYNWREGYMLEFGENPEHVQNGTIEMKITIFAATGLQFDEPRLEEALTESGRQRVYWTVVDIQRVLQKIGPKKRLSSAEFIADGEWYFDIYPNGFNTAGSVDVWEPGQGAISIYLHSSRRQVELGDVRKVWFRFGLKKQNPAELGGNDDKKADEEEDDDQEKELPANYDPTYFPPGSSCVSVFTPQRKCFGKHEAYQQTLLTEGREYEGSKQPKEFILGKYDAKGAVCFVLDMLVTDDECWTVQHMLHEIEVFGHKQTHCEDTHEPLKEKVICYHCGKAFSKEVTNYQARMDEYGYEVGREYITDILMREEEHILDRIFKEINLPDKIDQAIKWMTAKMAKMRMIKDDMEEDEDEDEDDDQEPDPDEAKTDIEKKKILKEQALQRKFEERLMALRLEVEDAHFSKPICSKCAEKRKVLQSCREVFANQPDQPTLFQFRKDHARDWVCPDQNALATVLTDGTEVLVPMNARKVKAHFRKGWRDIQTLMDQKYADMSKAFSLISVDGNTNPLLCHANDEWIKKKLPKSDPVRNELSAPFTKPGRNAMTLVRGNRYVEPLELAVQCCGRVNEMGIPPSMDEDAVRDTYCDVRFDVIGSAPKRVYCLYTGKVFCEFCAKPEYKVPLPQFEDLYDNEALVEKNRAKKGMLTDEPEPQQVCYDAKEKMGATLLRIQPESKMPEEEIIPKRSGPPPEEEDDDNDPFELLLKIPCFGKMIHKGVEDVVESMTS